MKCEQLRELIITLPLHDLPPALAGSIDRHARECRGCRLRLEAERALQAEIAALLEPASRAGMAERVLAATARLEASRAAQSKQARSTRVWPLPVGLGVAVGIYVYRLAVGAISLDVLRPLIGVARDAQAGSSDLGSAGLILAGGAGVLVGLLVLFRMAGAGGR